MKTVPPPATDDEIAQFEGRTRITLPADLRAFLALHNGGYPKECVSYFKIDRNSGLKERFVGVRNFYSIADLTEAHSDFAGRIPDDLLPFASDSFGNQLCIGVTGSRSNAVFFWDHEALGSDQYESAVDKLADSLEHFVNNLGDFV